MKRRKFRVMMVTAAISAAAAAVLLAGCGDVAAGGGNGAIAAADADSEADNRSGDRARAATTSSDGATAVAARTPRSRVEAFGKVTAANELTVSFDFAARVSEVYAENGQRLTRGTPVLTIDTSERDEEIELLREELAVMRLETASLVTDREMEIAQLENDIAFAQQRLTEEEEEFARRTARYDSGFITRVEMTAYRRELERLRKEVEDLRLSVERLRSSRRIDVERAKAGALESRISRLRARTRSDYLRGDTVVFPVDSGVITELTLSPGDRLEPGRPAFRVIDLESAMVEADVLEEFIREVAVGAAVEMTPVADRARTYRGTVTAISAAAFERNNETVVPVSISLDDADEFLRHGFNIDVYIEAE